MAMRLVLYPCGLKTPELTEPWSKPSVIRRFINGFVSKQYRTVVPQSAQTQALKNRWSFFFIPATNTHCQLFCWLVSKSEDPFVFTFSALITSHS